MDTEQMIQDLGANVAPRVTPEDVKAKIVKVLYKRMTDTLTVCVIIAQNGYNVTGTSACASPENYNKEIGEKIAYDEAFGKLYGLEGYLLKEQLYQTAIFNEKMCNDFDDDIPF